MLNLLVRCTWTWTKETGILASAGSSAETCATSYRIHTVCLLLLQLHATSLAPLPEHREEITLAGDLLRRLRKIDNVYKDVVSTREAAIDAEGFQLLSSIGKKQVESSVGELVFDPVVFAEKLVSHHQPQSHLYQCFFQNYGHGGRGGF